MINPIKEIWAIIDSHLTVFKHLFKRAVTLEYPEKKRELGDNFRGKPETNLSKTINEEDMKNVCVGCGICKRVCPSGAIDFEKDSEGKVVSYTFDLKKCIFCGNCKFYCPHGAIKMTKEYELAGAESECLKLEYRGDVND